MRPVAAIASAHIIPGFSRRRRSRWACSSSSSSSVSLRLSRELQRRVPGARLTRRMLLMLIGLAVPPVLVVYGFSLFFLNATIDTWFNVRLEEGLNDALEIGSAYLGERPACGRGKFDAARARPRRPDRCRAAVAPRQRDRRTRRDPADSCSATIARCWRRRAPTRAFSTPYIPMQTRCCRSRTAGRYAAADHLGGDNGLILRVAMPLGDAAPVANALLHALFPVPPRSSR